MLVVLSLIIAGSLFAFTEWVILAKTDPSPKHDAVAIIPTSISIKKGKRLSKILGCDQTCHAQDAAGRIFAEANDGTRIIAPSLLIAVDKYSPEEFETIVRHGIKPDGTILLSTMPAFAFNNLSNEDYEAILSYLESLPKKNSSLPSTILGPKTRYDLMTRDVPLVNSTIDQRLTHKGKTPTDAVTLGEYLTSIACTECHGVDLEGGARTPNLVVIAAYEERDFNNLMRTGFGVGGRNLGLMSKVATLRYINFTDDEVASIYLFLRSRLGI
jgi:mono/diheme cytochrome c family protein